LKKPNRKKNRLNRLNYWKNQPVWFGFGFISKKPKKPNRNRQKTGKKTEPKQSQTEKTEPNRKTEPKPKKTEKTEPNRFEPVFSLKKRTEPNRNRSVWPGFGSVSVLFFKKKIISVRLLFLIKTEPKMITSNYYNLFFLVKEIDIQTSNKFGIILKTIYVF